MIDYSKGKIYKLEPISGESECYIGSTCYELDKRLGGHKYAYNNDTSSYCTSHILFDKYGVDGVKITLIQLRPCENRAQLHKIEGEWQAKTPNCINKNIAGRTAKEWYQDNRVARIEYQKKRQSENKEQYLAYLESWRAKNKEYHKKYYQDNKENLKQKYQDKKEHCKEQYRMKKEQELQSEKDEALKNKLEINRIRALDNKTHYHCECGSIVMAPNKSLHLKSKKHMKYEEECHEDCANEL